ncbi:hypothetical protein OAV31_01340 [bacterium]|nr:hypothetical protein [Alphaproteobacteria bacterium]MDC3298865.1 hypothetical protein [bacterium]
MRINGSIASIIIAIILAITVLLGTGSFAPSPQNYATINYDGGYKRIGVIYEERAFTNASVEVNGRTVKEGSFEQIIAFLREAADEEGGSSSSLNLKDGVAVKAVAGIQYYASESSFSLNLDTLNVKSTQVNPVNQSELINKLEEIENTVKKDRASVSQRSITYGAAPEVDFLIPKILSFIDKLSEAQGWNS